MRRILITVGAAVLCSCAVQTGLQNTVWVNVTPAQHGDIKGEIVTSAHFEKHGKVFFNTAVAYDNRMEIMPYRSAEGVYKCRGSIKKGAVISIDAETVDGAIHYDGRLFPEGMILIAPDSSAFAYNIVDSVIIYK